MVLLLLRAIDIDAAPKPPGRTPEQNAPARPMPPTLGSAISPLFELLFRLVVEIGQRDSGVIEMVATATLGLPPPCGPLPAERQHELQLALAMRGGVSLAVWIGGACAEIEALRNSPHGAATGRVRRLGSAPRWWPAPATPQVVIDVLSGASAGGLNAALLSSALIYGARFDAIEGLVGAGRYPALLLRSQ